MQEHGTASSGNPRTGVVVNLDNEVVQPVVAPQAVAWFIGRALERAIIAAVAGVLAPGHEGIDADYGQQRWWPWSAVGAPP